MKRCSLPHSDKGSMYNIYQQKVIYDDVVGLEKFIQKQSVSLNASQPVIWTYLLHLLHPPSASPPAPEPMQIDSYHLTRAVRQRRIANSFCLYFGAVGHMMSACSVHPPHPPVSTLQLQPMISPLSCTTVLVTSAHQSVSAQTLHNLGSSGTLSH